VDIPFPTKVRDGLVSGGLAEPHHILPETGWVSFYLCEEGDVQAAIELLKRSYEIAAKQKPKRERGSHGRDGFTRIFKKDQRRSAASASPVSSF